MIDIRLTKKLAESLNGIDLSAIRVSDIFEMTDRNAGTVIREGSAISVDDDAHWPTGSLCVVEAETSHSAGPR